MLNSFEKKFEWEQKIEKKMGRCTVRYKELIDMVTGPRQLGGKCWKELRPKTDCSAGNKKKKHNKYNTFIIYRYLLVF